MQEVRLWGRGQFLPGDSSGQCEDKWKTDFSVSTLSASVGSGFVEKAQVIESIAKEHDTTSHGQSPSSETGNGMLSISLHCGPGETPSALEKRRAVAQQQRCNLPCTHTPFPESSGAWRSSGQ